MQEEKVTGQADNGLPDEKETENPVNANADTTEVTGENNAPDAAGTQDIENAGEGAEGDTPADTAPDREGQADIEKELAKAKAEANEYLQLLQRTQADFENFRRRARQEREEILKYGACRLVENMLPVLDNFERALKAEGQDLESFLAGVSLIFRQLQDVLQKEGVKPIEAVGTEFDPTKHEAVMGVESPDHPDNTVVEEVQKGYYLHDKVIRPAMVKVAKNS